MSLATLPARAPGSVQLVRVASYTRVFSVLNRPPPRYPGHVPLTRIERAALAVGSGLTSYFDPYRGGEVLPITGLSRYGDPSSVKIKCTC